MTRFFTALIQQEEDMYVALCPDLDIASQGTTIPEAKLNLREAIELFLETADPGEVESRSHPEQYVSTVEVAFG
jgi:predicted RNase H-like HicB family nuclease